MPTPKTWFNVAHNAEEKRVVVNIHGYIGGWDISAADLMAQVNGIEDIDVIEAHINSYGGEVFEGVAIYNWLRSHRAKIETVIDSVAASIASLIFLAGEKRSVYDTSMGMVHLPWGYSIGNANQMRKDADDLEKIDQGTIRKAYRKAVGNKLDDKAIDELMQNETWLDSDELIEYGFATDRLDAEENEDEVADKLRNAALGFDVAKLGFNKMPQKIFAALMPIAEPKQNKVIVAINSAPAKATEPQSQTGGIMPNEVKQDQGQQQPAGAQAVNAEQIIANERKRIASIRAAADAMGVSGDVVENLVNGGKSVEDAIADLTAAKKLAAQQPQNPAPVTPQIQVTVDDADKFRAGATAALCMAAGVPVSEQERADVRKSEMPTSVHALLRSTLVRAGHTHARVLNMNAVELTQNALRVAKNAAGTSTGDLTNVLADTINKTLGIGYNSAPATWSSWAKVIPVNDFKNYSVAKISTFGDMDEIPEGFPFQQGAFSDKKEQGAVTVKGKSLNIPMQVFVNDDLGAMTRTPNRMGAGYAFSQNKRFYDYLFGTAAVGPTLLEADSGSAYAAFSTARGNFATGAGAPSTSTLNAARKAMRAQTAPKGRADDTAQPLNLVPSFIISSANNELTIEQLLMSRTAVMPTDPSKSVDTYNPFAPGGRTPLQMVIDAYIDSLSTTVWWLAADQNLIESMAMLALNGQIAPTVRSEESRVGEALGVNFDVYGAYAPFMVDFRGMYCHKGA